jgi:hypothetical protein
MFFHFLKIIFDISASKLFKNTKKTLILNKKNSKFFGTPVGPRS